MADDLVGAMKIAGSGLEAQTQRLRVVSENLANVHSTGTTPGADPYARKTITFSSVLDQAAGTEMVRVESIGLSPEPFRVEKNPAHPAADAEGNVKLPNVSMIVELADMREANRSYEANLQVVKQARDMISMTIDLLRRGG
ncbi:MAG: flagellar basal body rod protein FlgC [Hyphomicrobiaceae bacterium]